MDWLLLQKLHLPCEGINPSGTNLEYDNAFLELMRLSEQRPEIQYGSTIVPARKPDWNELLERGLSVAQHTRDLRVGVLIVDALTRIHHWAGLAAGLELVADWTEHLWETIYPQLDPEDELDPTARLGCLSHLISDDLLIRSIFDIPLVQHRTLGSISLRDYNSIYFPSGNSAPTKLNPIEAEVVFRESEKAELLYGRENIRRSQKAFCRLNDFLIRNIGSTRWSGLRLMETLGRVEKIFASHSVAPENNQLQAATSDIEPSISVSESAIKTTKEQVAIVDSRPPPTTQPELATTQSHSNISSRSEAIIAIDNICTYFEINEPASPVPLLLQRAKRLIPMNFVEILRELAPNEGHQLLQHLVSAERLDR
ncbi:MAG: type VI secretion system protein TssA [Pirellula sp.]